MGTSGARSGGTVDSGPDIAVQAMTAVGQDFVALAEKHALDFAQGAATHDLDGTFPFENFEAMRESSFLAATVPVEHGGLGVESVHDLMVGVSRLARGDASTAIAVSMHLTGVLGMVHALRRARAAGDAPLVGLLSELFDRAGNDGAVLCFPLTEPGTDHTSPRTEATPRGDYYTIKGRKTFATLSPVAHYFVPSVRVPDQAGGYRLATALIPRETPGVMIDEDWDALGMRASGSNDVLFDGCEVPAGNVVGSGDYGILGPGYLTNALLVTMPLAAAYLGIAEAARTYALAAASTSKGPSGRRLAERATIQHLVAKIDIDLSVCRALLERIGRLVDGFFSPRIQSEATAPDLHALMKEAQCVKYTLNSRAVDVVDRSMTVCGGRSYLTRHPLSRLYRDVRAGSFMQPFSPHDALEYIGRVSCDAAPELDR